MKKTNDNLIGVIGDLHMKDSLSYADYLPDRRVAEKKEILDFIVDSLSDCRHVVFMGDNFNSRNNTSETNREFVELIERFNDSTGDHQIYIISGNHEKKGNGKTAIDFLKEVYRENWHIYTTPESIEIDGLKVTFLPYMLKSELGVETNEEATKKILKMLPGGDILFAHNAYTGTIFNGIKVETFPEPILPAEKLDKKYKLLVGGHIHSPSQYGSVLVTGSVFTDTVGEIEKFIYKIKTDLSIEKLKVPARPIYKLENPTPLELTNYPKNSIVKIVLTDKKISPEEIEVVASGFDAHLLIEDYPNSRKKVHIEEGAFDFSIEALLKLYSESKGVDYQKLLSGLHIING